MALRKTKHKYNLYKRRISFNTSFFKVRINAAKITLTFALLGAVILSILDYRNQHITQSIKTMIVDITLPLVDVSSDLTQTVTHEIRDLFGPNKKHQRELQAKDELITFWKLEVQRLRNELKLMQESLNYKKELNISALTTQLLLTQGHQFGSKGFLKVGKKSGVETESIVISEKGLVGKVVAAGESSAEVMLLSHPLSAVPAYVERNNAIGVVKGDLKHGYVLDYIAIDALEDGDRLVTSGQGGVFPRGINIAVVQKKQNQIKLHPLHTIGRSFLVYVISPLNKSVESDAAE